MKISILTPTRGRPQRLTTFIKSLDETASGIHDIEVVLGIDEDDQESIDFNISTKIINITKTIAPRDTMGSINTRCYNNSSGEIIILGNDDVIVRTQKWDQKIIDKIINFEDEIYLAFPSDGHKSKILSTFPILSRKCINIMGNAFPIQYKGSLIDLQIYEIFLRLKKIKMDRIVAIDNVLFEHNHFQKDQNLVDQTYRDRDRFGDDATYMTLLSERRLQAAKLASADVTPQFEFKKYPPRNTLIDKRISYLSYFLKILNDNQMKKKYKIKHIIHFSSRKIFDLLTSK